MAKANGLREHLPKLPFSAFFTQPLSYPRNQWRIRHSGVHTNPDSAPTTAAVLAVCESLGIVTEVFCSGGPCSAFAFPVEARFLDGGLSGQTGNYIPGERGVSLTGPKAVLLLAQCLGLVIRPRWYVEHEMDGVELDDLVKELWREQKKRRRTEQSGMQTYSTGIFLRGPRSYAELLANANRGNLVRRNRRDE